MLGLVLSENSKNQFPKKKQSVLIAKICSGETQKIIYSVRHGNNNNYKNIKICTHTGQHGILRNVSIPSDECTLPSSLTLRLKLLSKKAGKPVSFH